MACAGLQQAGPDVEGTLRAQRAAAPADREKRKAIRYGGGDPLVGRCGRFKRDRTTPGSASNTARASRASSMRRLDIKCGWTRVMRSTRKPWPSSGR